MTARFRISDPARADLTTVLATSRERWGEEGRVRYAALLLAALRTIARDAEGPTTRPRPELLHGMRSIHLRHARRGGDVAAPVHALYYRVTGPVIEIVRVLHERMEPMRHVAAARSKPRAKAPRRK